MKTELEMSHLADSEAEARAQFEGEMEDLAQAAAANDGYDASDGYGGDAVAAWLANEGVGYACEFYGLDYEWAIERCPEWWSEE